MMRRFKSQETDVTRGCLLGQIRIAYTMIEAARIRCEALIRRSAEDRALPDIHHDLGLAGYHASSNLASELRVRSLQAAHHRCEQSADDDLYQTLNAIFDDVLTACDAMSYVLPRTSDADLRTANAYALAGAKLLSSELREVTV